MVTVGDILTCLENFAPRSLKMDWDNVGLNCGSLSASVTKVLVALDPFDHVCQEAADFGAELVVTHHPLIFQPIGSVTDETTIGKSLQTLIRNRISHICLHTNLDCASGGVNDVLAAKLGLSKVTTMEQTGNLIRHGSVPTQELSQFLQTVKENLGCEGLRYVDGGKPVYHVAVGGGSCADALAEVLAAGCDTFVTADVKYNPFWDAKELGLNLIDAGHFHTENPVVAVLAEKLRESFPEITVKISETHTDCVKFY